MNSIGQVTIKAFLVDDNKVAFRTIDQILESCNEDHSNEFTPYDHGDWVEGATEFGFILPIFAVGQKFIVPTQDYRIVTLDEEALVKDFNQPMVCVEGKFPMNELVPSFGMQCWVVVTPVQTMVWGDAATLAANKAEIVSSIGSGIGFTMESSFLDDEETLGRLGVTTMHVNVLDSALVETRCI